MEPFTVQNAALILAYWCPCLNIVILEARFDLTALLVLFQGIIVLRSVAQLLANAAFE